MASVLLAHDPTNKAEVINDISRDTTNFFEVLQSKSLFDLFMQMAVVTPFSELQFESSLSKVQSAIKHQCHERVESSLSKVQSAIKHQCHERAFHFFVVCRQSWAGKRKKFATITKSRLRRGMNEQVSAWLSGVDGLYEVHQRLQRVVIRNVPALQLLKEFDNDKTVHYLDPPYHPDSRADKTAYGDDDTTVQDHEELIEAVLKSRSKILLSGYHSDLYDKELKAWNCTEMLSPNHSAGGQTKQRMVECVWRNFK
jgi:DNA adenine methylase